MSVRFNPIFVWLMVAFCGAGLIFGISALAITGNYVHSGPAILPHVFALTLGILMLRNPALFVTPQEVQMRNIFGGTIRRYPLSSYNDLEVNGTVLYVLGADGTRKAIAKRFLRHPGDWERLKQIVSQAKVF